MTVRFGTSGLRGPAEAFTPEICGAYVGAFLQIVGQGSRQVFVGADLRESTPRISSNCLDAIAAAGWEPRYAGNVPTPALAAYSLKNKAPAIMVTGSHIQESHNGIKFFTRDGELMKSHEAEICSILGKVAPPDPARKSAGVPTPMASVREAYVDRYLSCFPPDALRGLRIGVDLHSAVGRDLTVTVLSALGADCRPYRRSARFIALDTEAVGAEDIALARQQIRLSAAEGMVSTDGDGDRPLVIDERGDQIGGDVLGALTARALGIDVVVTPQTSTSAIEQTGWFKQVVRTRIGSPHVVAAMADHRGERVAGFEANGGFLLGVDIDSPAGRLAALPTRDALLPIICVLSGARRRSMSLSELAATMPSRIMRAGRLKDIAADASNAFLDEILASPPSRASFDTRLANPKAVSTMDGIRFTCSDGSVVHFRQSGNAPELRCYVETSDRAETERLLSSVMATMARRFQRQGVSLQ